MYTIAFTNQNDYIFEMVVSEIDTLDYVCSLFKHPYKVYYRGLQIKPEDVGLTNVEGYYNNWVTTFKWE